MIEITSEEMNDLRLLANKLVDGLRRLGMSNLEEFELACELSNGLIAVEDRAMHKAHW
jgi:uncharacterized membrane protein YcaP (DUF421 family)